MSLAPLALEVEVFSTELFSHARFVFRSCYCRAAAAAAAVVFFFFVAWRPAFVLLHRCAPTSPPDPAGPGWLVGFGVRH